jgi:Mitochondrial ribosomal death-associated protein 3
MPLCSAFSEKATPLPLMLGFVRRAGRRVGRSLLSTSGAEEAGGAARPSRTATALRSGATLEHVYRATVDETRAVGQDGTRSAPGATESLEQLKLRPDPLFEKDGKLLQRLRRTPEPLRSRLLQQMVLSLPPEELLDLGRYDESLAELLRTAQVERDYAGKDPALLVSGRGGAGWGDEGAGEGAAARDDAVVRSRDKFYTELAERPPRTPYASNVQYDSRYFVEEGNPAAHGPEAVGRVYPITELLSDVFPEGGSRGFRYAFKYTGSRSLLVRESGVRLKDELEAFRAASEAWFASGKGGHSSWAQSHAEQEAWMEQELARNFARQGADGAKKLRTTLGENLREAGPLARWHAALPPAALPEGFPRIWPARLLHGVGGIGKSCVLGYLVHYARLNGWLTVFLPDCYAIMHGGEVLSESRARPGFVDQNDVARDILEAILAVNEDMLAAIPQRRAYLYAKYLPANESAALEAHVRERRDAEDKARRRALAERAAASGAGASSGGGALSSSSGSSGSSGTSGLSGSSVETELMRMDRDRSKYTLKDMVAWGLQNQSAATDTLLDLLQELRLVTEFPVLIAVDGISELYEDSSYPFAGRNLWPTTRLSIPRALHVWRRQGARGFRGEDAGGFDASMHSMKRGCIVGATSFDHRRRARMMDDRAFVPPSMIHSIERLNRQEVHSLLLHYHHSGVFSLLGDRGDVDAHAVDMYRTVSSGIPSELRAAAQLPVVS